MTAVVVDASVAAASCLRDDEDTVAADAAMVRISDETSFVPGIFWHEMRNVLLVAERRGAHRTRGSGTSPAPASRASTGDRPRSG